MKSKRRLSAEKECRRLKAIRETLRELDANLTEFRRGVEHDLANELGEEETRRIMKQVLKGETA